MTTDLARFIVRLVLTLVIISAVAVGVTGSASAASIIYVNVNAVGANNGSSWTNAYLSLQAALGAAVSGDQIWVAKGTYKPGTVRTATFMMKTGVAVYGGFAGGETLLSQRNVALNTTVLSGELGALGPAGNVYHVVSSPGVDNTAVLDGFTISGGNANGTSPNDSGGGIYEPSGNATLANLIITGNRAVVNGGGMYNFNGGPLLLKNVVFKGNHSAATAGGLYNDSASPTLVHVTFLNNSADGYAGGMYTTVGVVSLKSVSFNANTSGRDGGGLYDVSTTITLNRVSFTGNKAVDAGGGMYSTGSTTTLTRVTFAGNTGPNAGGGMLNQSNGSVSLTNVTFSGNLSTNGANGFGGGLYNGGSTVTLTGVTFNDNQADYAAGMLNFNSTVTLTNSTLNANASKIDGGAVYNTSSGFQATNVTFSGNSAVGNGGAIFDDASSPTLQDSILWGDGSEVFNKSGSPVVLDTIVQDGCPSGSSLCTNVLTGDPKLGPLQANGGFTKTMALGAGSAALDTGATDSLCAANDQRGVLRPQGLACDMGAYEVRAMTFVSQGPYDGRVEETAAGSNVGGSLNAGSAYIYVGDFDTNQRWRGFLSFDTSGLPDASAVAAARLRVEQIAAPTGNPFASEGHFVADLASPYFGSGLPLVASDFQALATVSPAGVFGSVPAGNWYSAGLNSSGRSAINKTGTTQFRLRFTITDNNNTADYLTLYSGDVPTTPDRPVLIVYFNP